MVDVADCFIFSNYHDVADGTPVNGSTRPGAVEWPIASSAVAGRSHRNRCRTRWADLSPFQRPFRLEGSIKGSMPAPRSRTCKVIRNESPVCGAFAEPSDGLEPSTPSLPWNLSGS